MLYAVIRAGDEALHFIAELNPYNLQTLRDYARGTSKDRGSTEITIAVDRADERTLRRYTRGWRSRLNKAGVSVNIERVADGASDAAVHPDSSEKTRTNPRSSSTLR